VATAAAALWQTCVATAAAVAALGKRAWLLLLKCRLLLTVFAF